MMSCLFLNCSCWEWAGLLALLCDVFSRFFDTFPYGVPGHEHVWYLIVSIPDPCLSSFYFKEHSTSIFQESQPNLHGVLAIFSVVRL